jgi:hypothetical protein
LARPAHRTQITKAVLRLRELIFNGRFSPGERMSELPLVELLGVSRTPLRLALAELEHEGLLRGLPAGGYVVREFTQGDVRDAIELRGVLEGTAARFAELNLGTGGLCFACAGHPPPLLLPPGDEPGLDWGGRSTPVAVEPGPAGRGEQSRRLARGTTLVLYTDGLVEDRRRPADDGLQRLLREVVATRAGGDLGQTVRSIVARMVDPDRPDDVCVLAAQLGPGP